LKAFNLCPAQALLLVNIQRRHSYFIMSEGLDVESKRTMGEELFLIHLSRQTELGVDDFDHETKPQQRERGTSVGEELWQVHCKRACGNLDKDYEKGGCPSSTTPEMKTRSEYTPGTVAKNSTATISGEDEKVIHHLRNRDIKIP
jgi:hypothetical protein